MKRKTVGITGGGQLALMLIEAFKKLGHDVIIYDKEKSGCAHAHADKVIVGEYDDIGKLQEFGELCDGGITTEFENVPADVINFLSQFTHVCPSPHVIGIGQDRLLEKMMAKEANVATLPFWELDEKALNGNPEWRDHFPLVLKTRSGGYDGKNQWRVDNQEELQKVWNEIGKLPCILEQFVDFIFELSVIVGRNSTGKIVCYPAFQNMHETMPVGNSKVTLLRSTTFPGPNITDGINTRAQEIACQIAEHVKLEGILAIEFFFSRDGRILFNEMAPRPHNSGHGTRITHSVSQFDMLASILVYDVVPEPQAFHGGVMTNFIGDEILDIETLASKPHVFVKPYGKEPRPGRKVGHWDETFTLPIDAYSCMVKA